MDSDRDRDAATFFSGLLLGAVIGAGVALLTTPRSGRGTRRRLSRGARRIRSASAERFDEIADEVRGRVDDALRSARGRFVG